MDSTPWPGIRYDRTKEMDTPLYGEKTTLHLNAYRHMLLLKVDVRFGRGSAKPAGKMNGKNKKMPPSEIFYSFTVGYFHFRAV